MLITYENRLCNVEKVVNELGFNRYILCAVDTGEKFNKSRFEFDEADMSFPDHNMEPDKQTNATYVGLEIPEQQKKKARLETINDEDLNKLALNRNSKHTRTQTSWGVAVFKVKYQKAH